MIDMPTESGRVGRRFVVVMIALSLCLLLAGCASTGWQDAKPHYDSARPPARYDFYNLSSVLRGGWRSADGEHLWTVGDNGTILHYTPQVGHWETQNSGTTNNLTSIVGSGDGAQLWAVGYKGTILHYRAQVGHWEAQSSGTTNNLTSIVGSGDGAQLWAVGEGGTILHYTAQTERWEAQSSGTTKYLFSIFGSNDAAQLWAVGERGTILHCAVQAGRWEKQSSGTTNDLFSIFGSNDGAQLWAVGLGSEMVHYTAQTGRWEVQNSLALRLNSIFGSADGSQIWAVGSGGGILHYTAQTGRWEAQSSGTANYLSSIFGSSDGSQLWAVGNYGTILHYTAQAGRWEAQNMTNAPLSIFGSSDGAQLWAVGLGGVIQHYTAQAGQWETQSSGTTNILRCIFGSRDGSQLWAVGDYGTILHYTAQAGHWEAEKSGVLNNLNSIFVTSDSAQLWAVGHGGVILRYTAQSGRWELQSSGTNRDLFSIFGSNDGAQLWAVGHEGTILHYAMQAERWEKQSSGANKDLLSIFGSSDGAQLWAVGNYGTILHYTAQTGLWEKQTEGKTNGIFSIFGTSDGAQLWAVGQGGVILRYTAQSGRWELQSSGTTDNLYSIFGSSDGARLWAVGPQQTILLGLRNGSWPYISEVQLLPGAELQVRVIDNQKGAEQPLKLTLYGSRKHSFEIGNPLTQVNSVAQPPAGHSDSWRFDFNPTEIDVDPGTEAHLQIELEQGTYHTTYDVDLKYDRYRSFREHWVATLVVGSVGALIATFTLLLFTRPLWILYLYRKVKIYEVVEQIELPGVGRLLQFVLKLTILPWFVTHPRTLRAWVSANRAEAAAAWGTSVKTPASTQREKAEVDVPYVALPVEVKDVSSRLLNQPAAADFESLFHGRRSVVQIIGPGGGGKTTLAKHIGDLALAGGEPGAFKTCHLPIWIDEDFTDLRAVVKRKISTWYPSGEDIEEPLLDALLEKSVLLVMVDRVSERLPATQAYLGNVHGSVRCNALLLTTRRAIPMEIPEQRFVYPQALDSSTLLNFMTDVIKYNFRGSEDSEDRPFSTTRSQLELGKRLADLIEVRIATEDSSKEVPMLPLPVVLFVSDAVALAKKGKNLEALPRSLPDVYANYLRRINPKVPGVENVISDEDMLRAAKVLAELALGSDCIPKEFTRDRGLQRLKTEVSDLPVGIDPLRRLVANGVLLSKDVGATTFLRFALDPVAEFLAAEAHFDRCDGKYHCLEKLLNDSKNAQGFHNALLLTVQARRTAGVSSSGQV